MIMATNTFSHPASSWDEIIFENRNKAYGAFLLRKNQVKHEAIGLISACSLLIGTVLLLNFSSNKTPTILLPSTPPVMVPNEIYKFQNHVKQKEFSQKSHAEAKVKEPTPNETTPEPTSNTILPLTNTEKNETSSDTGTSQGTNEADTAAQGGSAFEPSDAKGTSNTIVLDPEIWPEYPGGEEALSRYLSRNLNYTSEARREGISGQVFVSFIIDHKGQVTNVKIIRGLGFGLDEQVKRAIELMPKWKAGEHSGKNVAVQYNMPVRFSLRK